MKTINISCRLVCLLTLLTSVGLWAESGSPLLSGYNPDPSICRAGDDYYIVTSSFGLWPGIPVYHSKDLQKWEVVGHAWSYDDPEFNDFSQMKGRTDDDGIWAPTIRYHDGTFYVVVTFRGRPEQGNYIVTAKNPAGPWSRPVRVNAPGGIDGSIFFDDDGKVYYQSNTRLEKPEWGKQCYLWTQEIDVTTGKLQGERHLLTPGGGKEPLLAEAPHIYKIRGKYYLLNAQGGTGFDHAAALHVSDHVFGPYVEAKNSPVLTSSDWGKTSELQALGHADLVDTPDGRWFAVCLGKRMQKGGTLNLLGRETFLCPVTWDAEGNATFHRDNLLRGFWRDGTDTTYSFMNHPELKAKMRKVRSWNERTETSVLKPGEIFCLYRHIGGYAAVTNTTDRPMNVRAHLEGETFRFVVNGEFGESQPIEPLCEHKGVKGSRFNGLLVGTLSPNLQE